MMKKVLFSALLLIMAVLSLHDLAGMAQAVMTPPGKFFPSAQLKKTLDDDKSPQSVVAGQAAIIIPPENFTIRRRVDRSEEHTSELQSQSNLVCRLLLEKKKKKEIQSKSSDQMHKSITH